MVYLGMGRCIRLGKMHPNIVMSLSAINKDELLIILQQPGKPATIGKPAHDRNWRIRLFQGVVTFPAHKKNSSKLAIGSFQKHVGGLIVDQQPYKQN